MCFLMLGQTSIVGGLSGEYDKGKKITEEARKIGISFKLNGLSYPVDTRGFALELT